MFATGIIRWFYDLETWLLWGGLAGSAWTLGLWWRDVIRERTFLGHHTTYVCRGLRLGFVLFLMSEAMFFFALFWAFFHRALRPVPEIGCTWPPFGITTIDPLTIPVVNTAVLLGSGVTITWAHHGLRGSNREEALKGLALTILLGLFFTWLQYKEYCKAPFTMADGIYGSCFYMMTGCHGLHVVGGNIFLCVNWWRTYKYHFSREHHLGFEFGVWY